MSSTTNNDYITIPNFGDITNISGSFSYKGGSKVPCATLFAPSGLEQYYCTAADMNSISVAINNISNYLNQGKTSTISVYTKEYIDETFYTKDDIISGYYTKTDITGILTDYYTKSYISANYYTNSYINKNYYTQTDINKNYYTKTDIDSTFYTKSYINKNYYTQTETIAQIVNAYKTQKISIPVDNISIKANAAGNLYINLKSGSAFNLKDFSPAQSGVIHAFSDGINLLWDYTLTSKAISELPSAFTEQLFGVDKINGSGNGDHYLTVRLDNTTLSSSITSGIFINAKPNHFSTADGTFAIKYNTNSLEVNGNGLGVLLKDDNTLDDMQGISVKIDNKSLIVDDTATDLGIGVAIDNDYIVLGNGGKHAGNPNIPSSYGLTLGDIYKQKIKDAPDYIPPAKGNIVFLYGTVSKIMNAISGFLSDSCCATNSQNIQDATWVFPFGTSPYNTTSHKGIYKDVLSSALFNINKFFANSDTTKPYLRFKDDDKTNITNIITTGKLPTQNLIINSNGKSSFQIYVFPIPESEFFTLPFALFDEYPNFTEDKVTSGWNYYYTNFDGAWKDSNGNTGAASDKDTTWEWTGSTSALTPIKSISGMWDDDVVPNFELPSSVWKYSKYTLSTNSPYQWSWQVPGKPDYFNPHDVLQDGDAGRVNGYLKSELSGIPVSTLYTYNRFKYSPGIYRPVAFNNIIQMLSTLRITGNSTFYIVFLNHIYLYGKPTVFDQPDCIPGSLGNIVFCSYYSFLLKIKSGMIPPYDLFNRYYQFNDTKLSGNASTDTEQWYDLNIAFNLNGINHENLYEMPYIVCHPNVDVDKLKKPWRKELGMTTRIWMQTNSSQILFKRIAFL